MDSIDMINNCLNQFFMVGNASICKIYVIKFVISLVISLLDFYNFTTKGFTNLCDN